MSIQCEMKILSLQAFDILEKFKHSLISALLKKTKNMQLIVNCLKKFDMITEMSFLKLKNTKISLMSV